MKKLLFLTCTVLLCAAGSMMAEETSLTTYDYNSSEWTSTYNVDFDTAIWILGNMPWTVVADKFQTDGTGYVVIQGGGSLDYENAAASIMLLNFGGEVGTVWCMNCANSGLSGYLNANKGTSFGKTVTWTEDGVEKTVTVPDLNAATCTTFFNLYWFIDPAKYSSSTTQVRARIYLNLFKGSVTTGDDGNTKYAFVSDTTNVLNTYIYGRGDSKGIMPSEAPGGGYTLSSSIFADESGDWDPSKWYVYELDFYGNGSDSSIALVLPFRSRALEEYALFIKKVEFVFLSTVDNATYEGTYFYNTSNYAMNTVTYTYNFTESNATGITAIEAAAAEPSYTVNGQDVTFEAGAQIYSVSGALVGVAQPGVATTLSKGFYVARVGNQGIKFAIQ